MPDNDQENTGDMVSYGVINGQWFSNSDNELLPKYMTKDINHLIIVAKMCISKFVYGDYWNLLNLFQHELKICKIFQT